MKLIIGVLVATLLLSYQVIGQTGTIQGTITDQVTKDEMVGAKVFLLETNFRTIQRLI
jgi:hypothetical protein